MRLFAGALLAIAVCIPQLGSAQDPGTQRIILSARVTDVLSEEQQFVPGLGAPRQTQQVRAEIVAGERKGEIIEVQNDFLTVTPGTRVFVVEETYADGTVLYFVQDIDRRIPIFVITGLSALVIIAASGLTGLRSLFSLAISIAAIVFVLLPLIASGWNPIFAAIGISVAILAAVMYITHGFSRFTHAAFFATAGTVLVAAFTSELAVTFASLSGFAAEASVYLNVSTAGEIDLQGLLLAAIIVGVLGVLDDIAITQTAAVAEIAHANPSLPRRELFFRAMRVGKEHVGALVNTLALAYVGASLPLLLLVSRLDTPLSILLNQEIFATEIVRTAVGSAALALTVPIATVIAIFLLKNKDGAGGSAHMH